MLKTETNLQEPEIRMWNSPSLSNSLYKLLWNYKYPGYYNVQDIATWNHFQPKMTKTIDAWEIYILSHYKNLGPQETIRYKLIQQKQTACNWTV